MNRSSDASWPPIGEKFEFKKGTCWIDVIRLVEQAEMIPFVEILILYFKINKPRNRLDEIICIRMSDLIERLKLNDNDNRAHIRADDKNAKKCGVLHNNQYSLTPTQLRDFARFIIRHDDYTPHKPKIT